MIYLLANHGDLHISRRVIYLPEQQMQNRGSSIIIENLFSNRTVEDLEEYLESHPDINLMKVTDGQGNNVLHQLAYEGHFELVKVFVRKAVLRLKKEQQRQSTTKDIDRKELREWLNQRNNEGFTPLLYASFCGHLEIIRYLVEQHQVDFKVKTGTGLNPLHIAAQKNIVMPFIYFRGKLNLFELDELNSTPLHWAAYTNSEEVVSYILSETEELFPLNQRDSQGNTALMLAVTYGNTRVVRRLLIKGVDRYLKNNQGKTPLQMAKESEFKTISKMLDQNFSLMDLVKFYCNIKIEYKPKGKKYTIPILFIVSFILNLGILNFYLNFTEDYTLYTEIAIVAIMMCYYLSLLKKQHRPENKNVASLLEDYSERTIKKVCFICRNRIPKRGYHCDTCGVCIEQYDHHCTWICNCVGKNNIARFIIFIVMLVIVLAFVGIMAVLSTLALLYDDHDKFHQIFTFRYLPTTDLEKFSMIGCFLVNEVTSVFFFPVAMLCLVQIRNLLANKTTFEKMRAPSDESQLIKSKINKAGKLSLRNCRVMCTDTKASFSTSRASFSQLITEKYSSERHDHGQIIRS